jgi:hypothetical protein
MKIRNEWWQLFYYDKTNLLLCFQVTEGTVCIENSIIRETFNGSTVALDGLLPL